MAVDRISVRGDIGATAVAMGARLLRNRSGRYNPGAAGSADGYFDKSGDDFSNRNEVIVGHRNTSLKPKYRCSERIDQLRGPLIRGDYAVRSV